MPRQLQAFGDDRVRHGLIAPALTTAAAVTPAAAQDFTSQPITLTVGIAPGGSLDQVARVFAPVLAEDVVVDNRPGAPRRNWRPPQAFAAFLAEEHARWGEAARAAASQ